MAVLPEPATTAGAVATNDTLTNNLVGFVRKRFEKAQTYRMLEEQNMLEDLRASRSKYSATKLAAILQATGMTDPPYIGIIESRVEAIYAWLLDAILPPGQFPASLDATPVPELPEFVIAEIETEVQNQVLDQVVALAQSGQVVNQASMKAAYAKLMEEAKDLIEQEILDEARESAEEMLTEIKDQFAEGDWESAFRQALHDFVLGTAIMRAPVLKSVPKWVKRINPQTRRVEVTYEYETIPTWERLVPARFYESPDSTRHSVPWYVYNNSSSRADLSALLGDDSYNQKAVTAALLDYTNGYRETTSVEQEKATLENRTNVGDSELIDRLEYGGSVPGSLLIEFGVTDQGLIPAKEYDALVWVVGKHCIKAVINPNPVGLNKILSAGFREVPDSFRGVGVPRILRHIAGIVNLAARAIVMNVGIASGPLVEASMDRAWPGEDFTLRPWGVLKSTSSMMESGRAVNFYQPDMQTVKLAELMEFGETLADRETGIPRSLYAGESNAPTAGATSMLMSAAAKGAQAAVRNVDAGLIVPAVKAQVDYNLAYDESGREYVGDLRVVARGSSSMVVNAETVLRLKEVLRDSNNPMDNQIITADVRMELYLEIAKKLGLDPKLFGDQDERERQAEMAQAQIQLQMGAPTGAPRTPPAAAQTVAGSGMAQGAQGSQLFSSPEGSTP